MKIATEIIYRPSTDRKEIRQIFSDLRQNLPQSFSLGYRLALRNIKAKYRQSIMGIFWAFLPPLLTAGIWIFLNSQAVFNFENNAIPYPIFVLSGTLLWQMFGESITILLNNVQGNYSLLSKINFPHEALIFSAMCEIIFAALIKIILLAIALVAFQVEPSWQLFFSLGGILALIILGMAIGLLLLPWAMLYQDIGYGIPLLLQFGLYLTPVIYPKPDYTGIANILNYNPVTPLLTNTRDWLFGLHPSMYYFLWVVSIATVFFLIGILLFKLSMKVLIERIGS